MVTHGDPRSAFEALRRAQPGCDTRAGAVHHHLCCLRSLATLGCGLPQTWQSGASDYWAWVYREVLKSSSKIVQIIHLSSEPRLNLGVGLEVKSGVAGLVLEVAGGKDIQKCIVCAWFSWFLGLHWRHGLSIANDMPENLWVHLRLFISACNSGQKVSGSLAGDVQASCIRIGWCVWS